MRIIFNVKHRFLVCLKSGEKFLTFLTNLLLEGKISICSTIKKNLRLFSRKFSEFVVVVMIQHIFILSSVSQKNTDYKRIH